MRKKPKIDEDRISNLPESVTSRILSLVPTKDAVRTSVLSKAWKLKWTSIERIDLDDTIFNRPRICDFIKDENMSVNFVRFVERVIHQVRYNLTSFSLSLSNPEGYDHCISRWISVVTGHNVASLVVNWIYSGIVALPHNLLLNGSLINLELHLRSTLRVHARICYPCLKNLNLSFVRFINDLPGNGTLTLAFPVLETFKLYNCKFFHLNMVEVHAPKLNIFQCAFSSGQAQVRAAYSIKIVSTKLAEFRFSCEVPRTYTVIGQQVVYATLSYDLSDNEQDVRAIRAHAQSLLKGFSHLKELCISGSLTKAIAQSTVPCPVLPHLVRLLVCGNKLYAKGLLELLHATPILKSLRIYDLNVFDKNDYDCNAVERVPPCIKDQLAEFEFGSFHHERSLQVSLVTFLLNNGGALKNVQCVLPLLID